MAAGLRKPFLLFAWISIAFVLLIETGSNRFLNIRSGVARVTTQSLNVILSKFPPASRPSAANLKQDIGKIQDTGNQPPGYAIPNLALDDGLLFYSLTLICLALFLAERLQGRLQGLVTFIGAICMMVFSFVRFQIALTAMTLMVTLLLAPPFGTIAYFALFGFFDRGGASQILSVAMTLKVAFVILLVLAHQRFLQNKSLVALTLFSLGLNLLTVFLHGLVPGPLVSITDALGGVVNSAIALIWAVAFFIFSIFAILKAIRFDRSGKQSEGKRT